MNLPYGEYLLKVRYRNDVIDSSAKEYTLPIKVLPPIYLSSLAIFTYLYRYGFNHHCHLSHPLPNTKETETNSRQDQGGAKREAIRV